MIQEMNPRVFSDSGANFKPINHDSYPLKGQKTLKVPRFSMAHMEGQGVASGQPFPCLWEILSAPAFGRD